MRARRSRRPTTRPVKENLGEAAVFRARAAQGLAIILLCLAVLLARYVWLQVLHHEEFAGRSEANRIKPRALPPSRGLIYDRNGELLAENVPRYRLELVPEQVGDLEATLDRLAKVLPFDADDRERFHELRTLKRRFDSVPLKFDLSESEVARFAVHRHRFPGVDVVPYLTRYYPHGDLFTHVIGYVGRVDARDQERLALDPAETAWMSHVGKTGIERYYEKQLQGRAGYERVETNAQGRALRVLDRVPPTPGTNLYLSLDAKLQRATVAAFEGRSGSAVAIDPRTGEVLAMVSLPSFDANLFVNGISRRDYAALLAAPYRPLFNRALHGGYEPGSTLKPFVGLAGLALGLRTPEDSVLSTGQFRLPGRGSYSWGDWKPGGHGRVNLREAIAQSVNTYFYQLAVDLGADRMAGYLSRFGFGAPTGIDLDGEALGVLPTTAWKRATHNQPWYPGETVIGGIGQGYWVATPIQLASAVATLASRGVRHRPHLLRATQSRLDAPAVPVAHEPGSAPIADAAHFDAVREGMIAVMHGPTGTARAFGAGAPFVIAGKSGTAQRYTRRDNSEYDETRIAERLRHQALFVAFAPAEAPTIAVALVVEHGSSGSKAAAPVARAILDAWLSEPRP